MAKSRGFITIEGGEGAGKSTLVRFLTSYFQDRGIQALITREPGGSFLGEEIRELILHPKPDEPVSPLAELFLFLAARAQHIHTLIEPNLNKGSIVVCDRFNDSTIAYQSAARGLDRKLVEELSLKACNGIVPSLTLYLDVDPLIGIRRAKRRNIKDGEHIDRIEQEDLAFHMRVREGFQQLAKEHPDRIKTIDTTKPPAVVREQAERILDQWLKSAL